MKKAEFNKLKAKWYKKLEKSGFQDLEQDEIYFKRANFTTRNRTREFTWTSIQEYYQMASDFLASHDFESRIEQIIWEYHTNGISTRDIADTLNKVRRKKILRMTVWRIVKRLEAVMKQVNGVTK